MTKFITIDLKDKNIFNLFQKFVKMHKNEYNIKTFFLTINDEIHIHIALHNRLRERRPASK